MMRRGIHRGIAIMTAALALFSLSACAPPWVPIDESTPM